MATPNQSSRMASSTSRSFALAPPPTATFHGLKDKVQKLIWTFAAQIPQLIVLKRIYVNGQLTLEVQSPPDPLRAVCKMSRSECQKFRSTILTGANAHLYKCPGFFTNRQADTILFLPTSRHDFEIKQVFVNSALQVIPDTDQSGPCRIGDLQSLRDMSQNDALQFPIAKRYAMAYQDWRDEVYGYGFYNLCAQLHFHQVSGLTLVVGLDTHDPRRGTKLIEPRQSPLTVFNSDHDFLFKNRVSAEEAPYITWRGMAEKVRLQVEQYTAQRAAERAVFFSNPAETWDSYRHLHGSDEVVSTWAFHHEIRFLEAVSLDVDQPAVL